MKVERKNKAFEPVIIKLESQFEVDVLADLVTWFYNNIHFSKSDSYDEIFEFTNTLSDKLGELCSDQYNYCVIDTAESKEGIIKFK
jgi:hypothetical protein